MFLKIFNLIFWVGMIFFLGGITFMFVMDPEVTSDEFWIYSVSYTHLDVYKRQVVGFLIRIMLC